MNPMNESWEERDDVDEPIDEVQQLTWSLIDEYATEADIQRLEQLLLESDEARHTYVMCMQLHVDLHFLFNPKRRQLPEALQKILDAEKAKTSKTPLPLVNLPPTINSIQAAPSFS